jgi:predicted Zn-dependent protease
MRYIAIGLILFTGLCSCATTNLPPVTSGEFTFEEDEARIWRRSEEEQESLAKSGLEYRDEKLKVYLNDIGKKLQPPDVYERIPFEIRVLQNPYSNAFAYPNGIIYVHSGILARMDNEAQLATLLAHEMTHATHRHQVRHFRGLRNRTAVFASMQAALGGLPAIGGLASVLGEIGTMAAVSGYSQQLETEADMVGLRLMMDAGYDPREAPKLFRHIKDELEEEKVEEPFFFGSHPRLQERIDNYQNFLESNKNSQTGIVNTKIFRRKIARVIFDNAFLDLKAGRFQSATRGAEKYLSIYPKSPQGHYLLGEICRQKGDTEDFKKAEVYYRKAISLNSSYPKAFKGIGLLYFKQGQKSKARRAFQSYLRLLPQADDMAYVKEYINQCK